MKEHELTVDCWCNPWVVHVEPNEQLWEEPWRVVELPNGNLEIRDSADGTVCLHGEEPAGHDVMREAMEHVCRCVNAVAGREHRERQEAKDEPAV